MVVVPLLTEAAPTGRAASISKNYDDLIYRFIINPIDLIFHLRSELKGLDAMKSLLPLRSRSSP
ncbi:hypothetical protein R50072_03030 [Simiduia litorea]